MKHKIGVFTFGLIFTLTVFYFLFMTQEYDRINYQDGPHVIKLDDSTVNVMNFGQATDSSSNPEIEIHSKVLKEEEFLRQTYSIDTGLLNAEKSIYQNVEKVFAVGDVHGNFEALTELLKKNKIIDENLNWIFGKGNLLFCGDVFDRGDKVTECLWLIYKLEKQALSSGGRVHFLLGNHELMVLNGDLRYLHKKYQYIQAKLGTNYAFLMNKNTILGEWIRSKNTMVKINDILFVHGGVHPEVIELNSTISDVNQMIRDYLNDKNYNNNIRLLIGQKGPLWYRGYMRSNEHYSLISDQEIDDLLEYFNVKKIVFAHTTVEHIRPFNQGKLIGIDVTMTKDNCEGLFISNDGTYSVNMKGETLTEFAP